MTAPQSDADADLQRVFAQLFAPIARLAINRGLKFPQIQELLKQAFVEAARVQDPQPGHRDVSRVATTAGLTRREVARLSRREPPARADRSSPATQLFTRWLADRRLRDGRGRPSALPRRGPAPSFEALALATTRDVHPRRLLDELLRLGLAEHDSKADTVRLVKSAFVPDHDTARMLGFLGDNAGDHLAAGVANVLGDTRRHFEQALFVGELSDASVDAAKKRVQAQWRALSAALVPELEEMYEADQRNACGPRRRMRIGLYSFDEATSDTDAARP